MAVVTGAGFLLMPRWSAPPETSPNGDSAWLFSVWSWRNWSSRDGKTRNNRFHAYAIAQNLIDDKLTFEDDNLNQYTVVHIEYQSRDTF